MYLAVVLAVAAAVLFVEAIMLADQNRDLRIQRDRAWAALRSQHRADWDAGL